MKTIVKKGEIKRPLKKSELTEQDVQEVNTEESLLDRAERELEVDGIVQFTNETVDRDYLRLPAHLDEESNKEIGRYLHTVTQQRVWTRTLLSRVKILLLEANEELDRVKAKVFAPLPAKMSVKEKELSLYENEDACAIMERIKAISAKYEILDAYMENLKDIIFDVSREISRRGFDINSFDRAENVENKRK